MIFLFNYYLIGSIFNIDILIALYSHLYVNLEHYLHFKELYANAFIVSEYRCVFFDLRRSKYYYLT